jgi:hypothetical protein
MTHLILRVVTAATWTQPRHLTIIRNRHEALSWLEDRRNLPLTNPIVFSGRSDRDLGAGMQRLPEPNGHKEQVRATQVQLPRNPGSLVHHLSMRQI